MNDFELVNRLAIELHFYWLQFQNGKINERQYTTKQDVIYSLMTKLDSEIDDDLSEALYEIAGVESYHSLCPSGNLVDFEEQFQKIYKNWKMMK